MTGLPVSRVVNLTISALPTFPSRAGFGLLNIVGKSSVIGEDDKPGNRIRTYASIDEVGADFDEGMEEYLAAEVAFGQVPRPPKIAISRRYSAATSGYLRGGPDYERIVSQWAAVDSGEFKVSINGSPHNYAGMDFSAVATMSDVVNVLNTGLDGDAVFSFTAEVGFVLTSPTTGTGSTVSFLTTVDSPAGLDISSLLAGRDGGNGVALFSGSALESVSDALDAIEDATTNSKQWVGLHFTIDAANDTDIKAAMAWVQTRVKILGYTTAAGAAIDPEANTDLGSYALAHSYDHAFGQYSTTSNYAAVSALIRQLGVDYTGQNTSITLKFKDEPGIVPEELTTSEAGTLDDKNLNYFVNVGNVNIIEEGVTGKVGTFLDEVHCLFALQNAAETNVYGFLVTRDTKVPQTDEGMQSIVQQIEKACAQFVRNGSLAPGIWNGENIGTLKNGDFVQAGYYIYANPVALQDQGSRDAREGTLIQGALIGAGAIHKLNIALGFQR